jgi:CheY-like chemotaxis protein
VRRLRNLPAHHTTPVVLISEDKNPHALSKGFAAGASFFLYKPVENRSVLQLVRATQGAIENERRRTRRVPLCPKVVLINNQQALHADTVDVSMNGLLVQARSTLPVGSSVEVHLRLTPQETPIRGFGCIVRHAARNQMGIQLGHLGATERERLQEFLLHLVPLE